MSLEQSLFTPADRRALAHSILARQRLEEQYANLQQQTETASLGTWVFLATEVMFFGTLFAALGVYRYLYAEAFEAASSELNWIIGGINTIVLLVSSFWIVMAVHHARGGRRKETVVYLLLTAGFGVAFLGFKGLEYYLDFRDQLVPRLSFDSGHWVSAHHLSKAQVPHVELFLLFYWIMTAFHGLHVTIGVVAVLAVAALCWKRNFTGEYYSPVDVLALYWHFVDIVWIFLLPMLYLLGTHHLGNS
jgi:cytochrome c oxidase subunit 3